MVQSVSAERTLVLPEYNGQTVGLSWPLIWPAKDPGDADMDFSLDVSGWLTEIQDTVASVVAVWQPDATGDITISSVWSHNSVVTVLVSGGVAFQTYDVTLTVASQLLGEKLTRTIQLPVEPRYSAVPYPMVSGTVSGIAQ